MRAEELTPAVLLPAEFAQTISAERTEEGEGEQDKNDEFPDQGDEEADAIGSNPIRWQPGIDRLRTEGKIGGQREHISQEPQHLARVGCCAIVNGLARAVVHQAMRENPKPKMSNSRRVSETENPGRRDSVTNAAT